MEPYHLRDDLKQEVILIICELPEEKLLELHKRKQLEFYTVKVIINQIRGSNSKFNKQYRGIYYELNDDNIADNIDTAERELREMIEDMAIEEVDQLYWYNKGLIQLYLTHGNFRAIQKETGIPWPSCYKTIRKSFDEIKEKFKK